GDRVTPETQERIRLLNATAAGRNALTEQIATTALAVVLATFAAALLARAGRRALGRKPAYLLAVIVLAAAAIAIAAWYAGLGIAEGLRLDSKIAPYFVPVALVTAIGALLVDARSSLIAGACLA